MEPIFVVLWYNAKIGRDEKEEEEEEEEEDAEESEVEKTKRRLIHCLFVDELYWESAF